MIRKPLSWYIFFSFLEGKLVHIQCQTEKLKQQVASQEMSVEELRELLETCEHLKGRVRSAEKCISELQEMAFECDRHIVQARGKVSMVQLHLSGQMIVCV